MKQVKRSYNLNHIYRSEDHRDVKMKDCFHTKHLLNTKDDGLENVG